MPNPNRGACGFQSSEFEDEYERPSKSELKRQMSELQKLGEELVNEARTAVTIAGPKLSGLVDYREEQRGVLHDQPIQR